MTEQGPGLLLLTQRQSCSASNAEHKSVQQENIPSFCLSTLVKLKKIEAYGSSGNLILYSFYKVCIILWI